MLKLEKNIRNAILTDKNIVFSRKTTDAQRLFSMIFFFCSTLSRQKNFHLPLYSQRQLIDERQFFSLRATPQMFSGPFQLEHKTLYIYQCMLFCKL
jgi:hypothetical protein